MKKVGIVLLMLGLMLGSGYAAFFREKTDERGAYLAKAEQLSLEEYHRDAILTYEKALALDPGDKEIQRKIAHEYLLAGEGRQAVELTEKLLGENTDSSIYTDLICGYLVSGDLNEAITKVKEAKEKYPFSAEIDYLYGNLRGTYEETTDLYSWQTEFRDGYAVGTDTDGHLRLLDAKEHEYPKKINPDGIDDYIVIQEDGQDTLLISVHDTADCVTTQENTAVDRTADTDAAKGATAWDGTAAKVETGDEDMASVGPTNGMNCRYVDGDGYLRVTPEGEFLYLGCPRDGRILFQDEAGWGYLDEDYRDLGVRFEEATAFAEGVAAVKESDGWRVVTPDTIVDVKSGDRYQGVIADDWKVCSISGNIFVQTEQGFVLVSRIGEVLSDTYDEVRSFTAKDGVAAVRKGETWGLIDRTGQEICPTKYEELRSGGSTLVAFRQGDLWGYMDRTGEIYVEPAFQSAGTMRSDGIAYVTVQEREGAEPRTKRIQMNFFYEEDTTLF